MTTTTAALSMATDQVLSWLNDEESTVSAQKIQQECVGETPDGEAGVSRWEASTLLKELYEKDPNNYVATVVEIVEETCDVDDNETEPIKVTTFSCNSNSNSNTTSNTTTRSVILALSKKQNNEPISSSHESDMAILRDRLFSKNPELRDDSWFYNSTELSYIQMAPSLGAQDNMPMEEESKTWHKYERQGQIVRKPVVVVKSSENKLLLSFKPKSTSTSAANNNNKMVKPTTAQSFFTKKPATTSKSNKPVEKKKTTNDTATRTRSSSSKKLQKSKTTAKPAFSKRVRPSKSETEEEEEEQVVTITTTCSTTTEADTNTTNVVGNADDFVGDEDEDSEDEQEMEERLEKSKQIVRKQKEQDEMLEAVYEEHDKDLQEDNPILKTGAMDAFCTKQKQKQKKSYKSSQEQQSISNKKRRKVLKEKTTVNAQGFLVTTTEAIWEDVSSDEEADAGAGADAEIDKQKPAASKKAPLTNSKSNSSKPKPKAKKASGMKQGSLMGFFKPK